MARRVTSIATPFAHLVGPGKIKIINGRLAFSTGDGTPTRLDPTALRTLLCYGHVGVSDDAMSLLLQHDVQVAWLTPAGHRCHGRLVRASRSTTALRIAQHQVLLVEEQKLELARDVVACKIESQIAATRHYQRQSHDSAGPALRQMHEMLDKCRASDNLDALRGIEGATSAAWFVLFGNLILPPFRFTQRVRRPPTDPVNALLSLGYTWLLTRTVARCEAVGLEVALGALHEYRPGRPSLACDLIEPMRVPVVDRWVLTLCNQKHVAPDSFVAENGGIRLQRDVFPRILASWEEHWSNGGHESSLDLAIQQLASKFRRLARNLPTGLDAPENPADVGTVVNEP